MSYKPFFKEWDDSKFVKLTQAGITLTMIALFMFLYINFPDQYFSASIYYNMLVLATMVLAVDFIFEKNWLFSGVDFGKSMIYAGKSALLGAGIMFVVFSTRTLSVSAPFVVLQASTLQFIYVVVAAPYIEEKFFRQMANFTCGNVFMGIGLPYGDILGVLFSSGCFALFHGTAFGWNNTAILAAFAFAIFVSVGNQLCKSAGFGFGAHLINNFLVYSKAVI